ncbi:glycosyltransferase family 4 protein [Spirochaetia bacterium 38H-sp]|uniref:Glycosyltransferase family 4 protein n=1 Tax=Rarispira pelagica TaxID=3141764 RepID=A0ABU9U9Q2_9SPIR
MKILFVTVKRNMGCSGASLYVNRIVSYLKDMGHNVKMLSISHEPSLASSYFLGMSDRFQKKIESILSYLKPEKVLIDDRVLPALWKIAKNKRLSSFYSYALLYKWESSKEPVSLAGYVTQELKKTTAKAANGIITSHPLIKNKVVEVCGDGCSVTVLPPGFDRLYRHTEEVFIKKKAHLPEFNILFVGNILNHKGLDLLLTALSYIRKKGIKKWKLNVAGSAAIDPSYVLRIREEIQSLSLANHVNLLGMVDDYTLADLYEKSHVVVNMSNMMEMGVATGEGFCYGTVPIASKTLGAKYWLENAGIWLKPNDLKSLSLVLYDFITDREKYLEYSLRAYRMHKELPAWKDSLKKALHILTE